MRKLCLWLTVPAGLFLIAAALPAPGGSTTAANIPAIIFTQIPAESAQAARPRAGAMLSASWGQGGRLVLLRADGSTRTLTQDFDSAADPSVSFDGKRVLFAGRKSRTDPWNIFEMAADGSSLRQITKGMGNCRKPIYQSALFYLNDARPSYQLAFVSDAAGEMNEYGPVAATNLYSMRFDGSGLRRLTYAVSSSYDPFQMQDGRILFSNWQRSNLDNGPRGRIDLFGIGLDGTDYAAFSGMQGRRIKHMACITPNGLVVFVESDRVPWDGAGQLGIISLRRNLHSYESVPAGDGELFHSPSPLPDGTILVSMRPANGASSHSLYRMDLTTGRRTLVFEDANYHNIQAVALVPRTEPDGHSSVVEDDQNWSKLYCLNVYDNDLKRGWLPPGSAARIRVLEGLPHGAADSGNYLDAGSSQHGPGATKDSLSGIIQKRLLGDVRLDDDGSFHLSVPPNIPIQLQLLDSEGMALRTSTWIWTKNKENRGCIGCHEDGERTPENVFAMALSHPAAQLTLPPERRRAVDFRRDVMPILAARCSQASCHGAAAQPLLSGSADVPRAAFNPAYEQLLAFRPTGRMQPDQFWYVDPGRARTSLLIWAISGRNTSRPWDNADSAATVKRMPPAGSPPLTDQERQTIIEWIDFGAPFNALPARGASRVARGGEGR